MTKPDFHRLWTEFPDHVKYRNMDALYTHLGGSAQKNITSRGFGPNGNACASRMSMAFNKAGSPINIGVSSAVGAQTLGTANGSRIIYRVADFRNYLLRLLGQPTIDDTSPHDDAFRGKKGIVAFRVNWEGASGHIALWNGSTYREPGHDNYAAYVNPMNPRIKTSRGEFWEIA